MAVFTATEPINDRTVQELVEDSTRTQESNGQEELIEHILRGDRDAFGEVVQQYSTLLLRTAYVIVHDYDLAQDAVQDALIQAWQHLPSLRSSDALRPWLTRIVVNQCISFKRKMARSNAYLHQSILDYETSSIAEQAEFYSGKTEGDWDLLQAVQQLPPKQRAIVDLHYFSGMTLPEIAQDLQTSQNTLKKRAQAALTNLRRLLAIESENRSFESVA